MQRHAPRRYGHIVEISPFRLLSVDFRDLYEAAENLQKLRHFAVAEVIRTFESCKIHETYNNYD